VLGGKSVPGAFYPFYILRSLRSNLHLRVGRPATNFLSLTNFDDVSVEAIESLADVCLFLFYRRQ
jgi:hypothetical protein